MSIPITTRATKTMAALAMSAMAMVAAALTGCADTPKNPNPRADVPLTNAKVDLPKYMGRWYIIAHIPYFLEKNLVDVHTTYVLRPDGKVAETFESRKGGFAAAPKQVELLDTPDPKTGNAYWDVQLFWPISASQTTVYVDDDYQTTLIGYKDKSLGWVFARTPEISEAKYQELMKKFDEQGYDTSRFLKVVQKPEQLRKPGFDSPAS